MTIITIDKDIKLKKTNFSDIKDLYNFMIENQLITEIGNLDENNLKIKSKKLLEKSRNNSNLINI
jgi:hypothetical protein